MQFEYRDLVVAWLVAAAMVVGLALMPAANGPERSHFDVTLPRFNADVPAAPQRTIEFDMLFEIEDHDDHDRRPDSVGTPTSANEKSDIVPVKLCHTRLIGRAAG